MEREKLPVERAGDIAERQECLDEGGDWLSDLDACIFEDFIEASMDETDCQCEWVGQHSRECRCALKNNGKDVGEIELEEVNVEPDMGLKQV
jgi:hypothetical protein